FICLTATVLFNVAKQWYILYRYSLSFSREGIHMPDKRNSRIDKFEKRRKNTKSISILAVAAAVMVLLLVGIGIFGGGNKQNSASEFVISNPESTEGQSSVQAESATAEEEEEIEDEKEQNSDEDDKDKEEK